jgi:L-fuculose-phosphate aldolase
MLDTICEVLKLSYQKGWISTRDGNASFRRAAENHFYITPSGVRKQTLYPELFIKLAFTQEEETQIKRDIKMPWEHVKRIEDDFSVNAIGLSPSGELPMHYLLQKNIPQNRVVLHLHPTYTIAAMYAGLDLQYIAQEFPEINRYTRVGAGVPQVPPISATLALEVEKAMVDCDIIGLDRHGVVAMGQTAWEAFEHVERLEHVCQIVLGANL